MAFRFRTFKLPTSVIVTVLGILLTAWLFPALTRQWNDRQKAHELKVGISNDIASATAQALFGGKTTYVPSDATGTLVAAVGPSNTAVAATTTRRWEQASFEIAAKIEAYFPASSGLATQWREYSDGIRHFFLALTTPPADRASALSDAASRIGVKGDLVRNFAVAELQITMMEQAAHVLSKAKAKQQVAEQLRGVTSAWISLYAAVEESLLVKEGQFSYALLRAHPIGYSTTAGDFLRDLVP